MLTQISKIFKNLLTTLLLSLILFSCHKESYFLGNTEKEFTGYSAEKHIESTTEGKSDTEKNAAQAEAIKLEIPSQFLIDNAAIKDIKDTKKYKILFVLDNDSLQLNQNIVNSIFLTLKEFKSDLSVYFIDVQNFANLKKTTILDFSAIIGPLNTPDKEIRTLISSYKLPYISLNKKAPKNSLNKLYFRPTAEQRYNSLITFLLNNKTENHKVDIAFLLPANKKANNFYESLRNFPLAMQKLNIVNVEFYNENNQRSVKNALEKIKNNLTHFVLMNADQKQVKINFKELKNKEKKNLTTDSSKFLDAKNIKQIKKQTEAIFILANDADYEYILSYLNKEGLFEKNIIFVTESRLIQHISNKEHFKNFFFIWANPFLKTEFDAKYLANFNIAANEISYLVYDLLAGLINWLEFEQQNPKFFAKSDIFYGIYGDFNFDLFNVKRRYGVYKLDENLDFYLYSKPETFFN